MLPADFLADVLEPNIEALRLSPGDLRLAVNAIMTIDAFFGIFAATTGQDDGQLKDSLAANNHAWRLVRDTAFALKHGVLKAPKPRLVRSPSAFVKDALRWADLGTWNSQLSWNDTAGPFVLIEHDSTRLRADLVTIHSLALAKDVLNGSQSAPITLAYLQSQGVFG